MSKLAVFSTFKQISEIKTSFTGSYEDFQDFELARKSNMMGWSLAPAGLFTTIVVFTNYVPEQKEAKTAFIAASQPFRHDLSRKEIKTLNKNKGLSDSNPMSSIVNSVLDTSSDKPDAFNKKLHAAIEQNVSDFNYAAYAMPVMSIGTMLAGAAFIEISRRSISKIHAKLSQSTPTPEI